MGPLHLLALREPRPLVLTGLLIAAALWAVLELRRRTPTTGAGASAERHVRALRTPLVRVADALGIKTRAGARAGRFTHAAKAERRVGALLDTLTADGFTVLHDRYLHGKNIDHLLIGPLGDVTVGDTKGWSALRPITVRDGRLYHGRRDVTDRLSALHWEADQVSHRLDGVRVRKLVIMQGPRLVHPDGRPATELTLDDIRIIPAARAVEVMRRTTHIPGQRSHTKLVALAEHTLPPHTGR